MVRTSFVVTFLAAVSTAPAIAAPSGPAGQAIAAYMRGTGIPCYKPSGEGRCSIAALNQGTKVFYGKPDSLSEMAVAFVVYQYDATGNGMDQMAIVFRKEGDRWLPVGRADNTVGSSPRNVRFAPGAIAYTGTVVGQNDSRANPTGKGTFRLVVTSNGVTFGGKGNAGVSLQNEIQRRR
ncbi:hypothetical protein ACLBXO_20775 [Methylobacterium sp. C33D]